MTPMLISRDAGPFAIALLGLILGMRHATDTDHVIAVTTIVSAERRMSAATRIGIAWGLGHSITVFLVGGAIILFKLTISPRLSMGMEFAVAVVLILLGLSTLARTSSIFRSLLGIGRKEKDLLAHTHSHEHAGIRHLHPHAHVSGDEHLHADHLKPLEKHTKRFATGSHERAFGVGLVHGLAGSAAIALLVLTAIPGPILGLAYLAIFGLGTIIGMAIITTAIGLPMTLTAARLGGLNRTLLVGAGLLSLGFGLFLAYQIGIVDGLFKPGAITNWTPT
jgi:ABC-type nickel/cobalt efflux system permease component RcnA